MPRAIRRWTASDPRWSTRSPTRPRCSSTLRNIPPTSPKRNPRMVKWILGERQKCDACYKITPERMVFIELVTRPANGYPAIRLNLSCLRKQLEENTPLVTHYKEGYTPDYKVTA